jgi:uncharacterized protein (TIGR03437 family)
MIPLAARFTILVLLAVAPLLAQSTTLRITTTALPRGTSGMPYSVGLSASGGRTPYRWAINKGGVAGVSLSAAGELTVNTVTFVGQTVLTVSVTDSQNRTDISGPLLLSIAPPLTIETPSLPVAIVGQPYTASIVVSGGVGASPPTLTQGSLPPGLTLSAGVIRGTPTAPATAQFAVESRDLNGAAVRRSFTLRVTQTLTIQSPSSLAAVTVGQRFRIEFQPGGGVGPFQWSRTGSLPAGVAFTQAGVLTGSASREGTYNFRVTLTDTSPENQISVSRDYSLRVVGLLTVLTDALLPTAQQGQVYSTQLRVAGGAEPIAWRLASGALPRGLALSANGSITGTPSDAGAFTFTATATDANGVTASRTFLLNVAPTNVTVRATAAPDSLFAQVSEAGAATERTIRVETNSPTPVLYQAVIEYVGRNGAWLTVTDTVEASAASAGLIRVSFLPAALSPGSYSALIRISGQGANNLTVAANLLVTPGAKLIIPTPVGLTFSATEGGSAPPSRRLSVINGGVGSLVWNAAGATLSGGPNWLTLSSPQVLSEPGRPGSTRVSVDPRGLAPGLYYGTVRVEAPEAQNSPQILTVVMEVRPRTAPPRVDVEPSGLILAPGAEEVLITNTSDSSIDFFTSRIHSTASPWFEANPPSGTIPAGGQARLFLGVFTSGLSSGLYRGRLNIAFSHGQTQEIDLVMVVPPGGFGTPAAPAIEGFSGLSPDSLIANTSAAICAPTQLVPISTLFGSGFNVPAGWPTPVEVRVVTDCGVPQTSGSVAVTFSNGDAPLNLAHVGEGRWSGTWVGRNAITPQVTMTVRAEDPAARLQGTYQTTGGIVSNTDPPILSSGGIVNSASYRPRAPIAPGTLVSIFGTRLATATAQAPTLPLETTLGVTTVTLGGRLLPLMYASGGQINAIVPYDMPLNTPQGLLVRRGTSLSVPEQVVISATNPGVFSSADRGAVVDAFGRAIGPDNPAVPGESIAIYTTGLGEVQPTVIAGTPAPSAPLAQTRGLTSVTLNGLPCTVTYSGLSPGFAGLYQVNVILPAELTTHAAAPLVVMVDGQPSNTVVLPIR